MDIENLCKLKIGDKIKTSEHLSVDDNGELKPNTTYTVSDAIFKVIKSRERVTVGIGELDKKYKLRSAQISIEEISSVYYSHECFN